ncbi:MAG: hypothetical protein KDD44_04080 [Bdellovibrionales bacterium]|nr:hypothetical protein [Bdellovibrionales bacterium]
MFTYNDSVSVPSFIRGLSADMDHCTVHSTPLHLTLFALVCERLFGAAPRFADIRALRGLSYDRVLGEICRIMNEVSGRPPVEAANFYDQWERAAEKLLSGQYLVRPEFLNVSWIPGAELLVSRLGERFGSDHCGVNTVAPPVIVDIVSHALPGFRGLSERRVTLPDYQTLSARKVDAAGWQLSATQMDVSAEAMMALEDHPDGALGALRAGYGLVVIRPKDPSDSSSIGDFEERLRRLAPNEADVYAERLAFVRHWDHVRV